MSQLERSVNRRSPLKVDTPESKSKSRPGLRARSKKYKVVDFFGKPLLVSGMFFT